MEKLIASLSPRSYRPHGRVLNDVYATMLKSHPESFDCVVYPAKDSSHDERLAVNAPAATLLDRDERAQEHDPPQLARAYIIPNPALQFDSTDSGLYEAFNSTPEAITLICSLDGLRTNTLIQWKEWLDLYGGECVERTVYVAEIRPLGKTLTTQMAYVCYPLPAMGELPKQPQETMEAENPQPPENDDPDTPENPAPEIGDISEDEESAPELDATETPGDWIKEL